MNTGNLKNNTVEPKRLTVVSAYFYPKIGGLETIAYTTAKKLHQSGEYKVSIITSNYGGSGYKKEIIDDMTVHRLPIWFRFSNTPINFMWYFWIKKIYKEEGTEIVHTHSPVPFMADIAIRVAKNNRIPTVATYHSGSMKKGKSIFDPIIYIYEKYVLREMFRISTAVVTVHQAFMNKNYPEFAYKTSFIPTGVDLARFKKTPLNTSSQIITFIGRIEHSSSWKGISELIKAMKIVLKKTPNAKLELVGGGDALNYYRDMANNLDMSKSVSILGPKYGDDLISVYEKANVVVLPSTSDSEAFSVTLVEAMASGRPIIGTNIGGTPQVIQDGVNGLLIKPKDPEALADAILRIIQDPVFAEKLGNTGASMAQNFSWEIQVSKYNELFKNIIK